MDIEEYHCNSYDFLWTVVKRFVMMNIRIYVYFISMITGGYYADSFSNSICYHIYSIGRNL